MRLILVLVLLVLAGFGGWIYGSVHPAPQSIVAPIQQLISPGDPLAEDTLVDNAEPSTTDIEPAPTTPTPAPTPSSPSSGDATIEQIRGWISEARAQHPYPESEERMVAVMMCESGGRADIINPAGPYSGLFQYATQTWGGDWNDYRDSDILDARAQVFATALAWNKGMQSHWGCYTHPR